MVRLATLKDFNFIYNCYMHPVVNPFLLYEVMDSNNFQPIFEALLQQEVKYVYSNDGQNIGMFKLIPLQHRNDHIAYLGGLAIHPAFVGKGEGGKMMKEIITLAEKKHFLRIELSVAQTNKNAIRLYKAIGFHEEGILKKYTHLKSEQIFIDEIMMANIF